MRGRAGLSARCWAVRLRRWDAAGAGEAAADWQRPPCNQRAAPPRPPPAPPRPPGGKGSAGRPVERRGWCGEVGGGVKLARSGRGGAARDPPGRLLPRGGQRQVRPRCRLGRGRLGAGGLPPPRAKAVEAEKGARPKPSPSPSPAAESGLAAWRAAPRLRFYRKGGCFVTRRRSLASSGEERPAAPAGFRCGVTGEGGGRLGMRYDLACTVSEAINRAPLPRQGSLERHPRGLTGGESVRGAVKREHRKLPGFRPQSRRTGEQQPRKDAEVELQRLPQEPEPRSAPGLHPQTARQQRSPGQSPLRAPAPARPLSAERGTSAAPALGREKQVPTNTPRPLPREALETLTGAQRKKITVGWLECLRMDGGNNLKLGKTRNRFHTISNLR